MKAESPMFLTKPVTARYWVFISAILILYSIILIHIFLSVRRNNGHMIYTLDDAYIHMAMAKNFARYGVWGITRYEFSSSSSSILWTTLVSITYFLFGVNEFSPLVLNIVSATILIFSIYRIIYDCEAKITPFYLFIILLGTMFIYPLPGLIFNGMEHVLHALITVLFAYLSAKMLAGKAVLPARDSKYLLLLASLLPASRYEGLFPVFVVCILFMLRKQWKYALLLGTIAVTPLIIYGAISVSQGWFWLPNSIIIKSSARNLVSSVANTGRFGGMAAYFEFNHTSPILLPVSIAMTLYYLLRFNKNSKLWENSHQYMLLIFIFSAVLHMCFIGEREQFRYRGYLIIWGLVVIAVALLRYIPQLIRSLSIIGSFKHYAILSISILLFALIFCTVLFFGKRVIRSLFIISKSGGNIYDQQYQMGLFLKQYYQGVPVIANDIGAINYLADINCLDIMGLGSLEIAQKKINKCYDSNSLVSLAKSKGVKLAIVYDSDIWIGSVPPQWTKIGRWRIEDNRVCAEDTVSFFAVDNAERDRLTSNFKNFSANMAASIEYWPK